MKIILRGLNGAYVNFDNVFKIEIRKPHEEGNPWRVIAYDGVTSEWDYGECDLFAGTEEAANAWMQWFAYRVSDFEVAGRSVCFALTPDDFDEKYEEYWKQARMGLSASKKDKLLRQLR